MKMQNKKGFTLVELLVAISIMGIILVIALPQISNIQTNNKKLKYQKYAESLLTSAKLYTDSYAEDMFGNNASGCVDISFDDMQQKGLLKDIKVDNSSCKSNTFIRVRKANNHYTYEKSVYCSQDSKEVYKEVTIAEGDTCIYGPDEQGPTIQPPEGIDWTKGEDIKVQVIIKDEYGLLENTKIKLSWIKDGVDYGESEEYDFQNKRYVDSVTLSVDVPQNETGIFKLKVTPIDVRDSLGNRTVETKQSGEIKLDNTPPSTPTVSMYKWANNSSAPTSTLSLSAYSNNTWSQKKVYTKPSGSTDAHAGGVYYQYKISGAEGNEEDKKATHKSIVQENTTNISWRACDKLGNCTAYTSDKTIKVDMTPPTTPSRGAIRGVSGSDPIGKIKTAALGSEDNESGVKQYLYLVTNTAETPTDKSLFTTDRTFIRSCGTSYYAWAIAVDNAGNMSDIQSLGNTKDGENKYGDYGACSAKCGESGVQTSTNSCALITDTATKACNRFDCCSSTVTNTTSCTEWKWSECTKQCGGGTKYEYRTCDLVSANDTSVSCPGTIEQRRNEGTSCNTQECEEEINKLMYNKCDSYYITTCSSTVCKYTQKNGISSTGEIERSSLSDEYNKNLCESVYCAPYIASRILNADGTTYLKYTTHEIPKCAFTAITINSRHVATNTNCEVITSDKYWFIVNFTGLNIWPEQNKPDTEDSRITGTGCNIQVNYTGPFLGEYSSSRWTTFRCQSDCYCTSTCSGGTTACQGECEFE